MTLKLVELTADEVIGFNKRAIADDRAKNRHSKQQHQVVRPSDLKSCLGSIFYQSGGAKAGYVLPLEDMAGLLLYRIAQGQFFLDGNKRTALMSCYFFLFNNGYELRVDKGKMNDLIWGFATDASNPAQTAPKYKEPDAIQYVYDNISIRT